LLVGCLIDQTLAARYLIFVVGFTVAMTTFDLSNLIISQFTYKILKYFYHEDHDKVPQ
jgi:hypothetical protein